MPASMQPRGKPRFWPLIAVWLLCAALLWFRAGGIPGPFVFSDESVYFNLGKTIYINHDYAGNTQYNPLYPLIISGLFSLPNLVITYDFIRILNPLLWSSALFPLFLISRRLLGNGWFPWLIALGSIIVPLSVITPIVWAEPLFYPLSAWSVYFAFKAFNDDRLVWPISAGVSAGLTFLTKQSGVVFAIAIGISLVIHYLAIGRLRRRLTGIGAFMIALGVVIAPWLIRNLLTPNAGLIGYGPWVRKMVGAQSLSSRVLDALGCSAAYMILALCFVAAVYYILALPLALKSEAPVRSFTILTGIIFLGQLAVASLITVVVPFQEGQPIFFSVGRYIAMVTPYLLITAGLAAAQKEDVLRSAWRKTLVACLICTALVYVYSPLRVVIARASLDAPDVSVLSYVFYGGQLLWGDTARVVSPGQRMLLALFCPGVVAVSLLLKRPRQRIGLAVVLTAISGFMAARYIQMTASAAAAHNQMGRYLVEHKFQTREVAFDPELNLNTTPIGFWQNGTLQGASLIRTRESEFRKQSCFDFGTKDSPVAEGCSPVQAPGIASVLYDDRQGFGFEPDRFDSLLGYFQPQVGDSTGLEDFVYGPKETKFYVHVPAGSFQVGLWAAVTDPRFAPLVDFETSVNGQVRSSKKTSADWSTVLTFKNVVAESGRIVIDLKPASHAVWMINKLVVVADRAPAIPPSAKYYLTTAVLPLKPEASYGDLNLYRTSLPPPGTLTLAPIRAASAELQDELLVQFSEELSSQTALLRLRQGERTEVPVTIKNTSGEIWHLGGKYPIDLAYVWLSGDKMVREGDRTLLPKAVAPGESVSVKATVTAPAQNGVFQLRFSMVQEGVTWFYTAGAKPLDIKASVN